MFVVCDLHHQEGAHVPFNAGLLEIIRLAFPEEKIFFFAEQSHFEQVRRQVGTSISSSISWKTIASSPRKANYLPRLVSEIRILNNLVNSLGASANDRFVFTFLSASSLLALKLLERVTRKNLRIQVISHGEIKSGVIGKRHRHPWRRFKEMRTALALFSKSTIQYLVLEHGIKERILQSLPSLAGRIEVLEHPLPPCERNSSRNEISRPVQFGFLGLANEMKGFSTYLDLVAAMSKKHPGKAEFHVIGRLASGEGARPEMEFLATKPGLERLSREEFVERIKRLHFIIMPYRLDYYELSPSGTLLDAIAWRLPIIAAKLPIFENAFKNYGNIGYLFSTETELHAIVENLVKGGNHSHYGGQVANLHKAFASRAPERLAAAYREICNRGMRLPINRSRAKQESGKRMMSHEGNH
jgi:hypothetical protein